MIDLTKIDLPLHELDDETAAALFLAWRASKPVEILATNGNWAFWASGHLCLGATYRLRPGTCDWRDSLVKRPKTEGDADAIKALQAQLAAARDKALEDAARMVDCACECREAVLTANTRVERWNACGRDPCGALDAAAIRAMKGEGG